MLRRIWIYLCAVASLMPGGKAAEKPACAATSKTMPGAVVKNVNVEEAEALLKEQKHLTILDVRTPEEFAEGHLAHAQNLNFFDPAFQAKLSKLDKNQPYLIHCATGNRSSKAREILKKLSFKTIYHLEGGLKAWIRAGKPVVK